MKNRKLQLLKLVRAKLDQPPEDPLVKTLREDREAALKKKSESSSTPPKDRSLLEKIQEIQALGDAKIQFQPPHKSSYTLRRLERELDEMRRDLIPRDKQEAIRKAIAVLRGEEVREEGPPSSLWQALERRIIPLMGPVEAKAYGSFDPLIDMEETKARKVNMLWLAERLISPKDRASMEVVYGISKLEGTEDQFLHELERQLRKGAAENPRKLKEL